VWPVVALLCISFINDLSFSTLLLIDHCYANQNSLYIYTSPYLNDLLESVGISIIIWLIADFRPLLQG
jgi:hypothetical protein